MILPYRLEARTTPSRTMQLAVPLIAALLTLAIGFLIFSLVGRDPLEAMHAFFIEPLSSVNGWSAEGVAVVPDWPWPRDRLSRQRLEHRR
jgi:ABC-type uncharacterized transport system permease subunit